MATETPLEDVFDCAIKQSDGECITLDDVLEMFGERSFGPILILGGLFVTLPPMSGIPGLPATMGVILILIAGQVVFGRRHIWLPGFLRNRAISEEKLRAAERKSSKVLGVIDATISERLDWATSRPAVYVSAVIVVLLSLAMIPLELVPFAVAIPGLAITMIGVALMARDGALMLIAFALAGAAVFVLLRYSPLLGWLGLG